MSDRVSRREFLGVLGTASFLPLAAAGQTFPVTAIPSSSRMLWPWVRAQLVLDPGLGWLDTARFGPVLRAALAQGFRNRESQSTDFPAYEASSWSPERQRQRIEAIATFLGAQADDVVLTSGATEGLNLVAHGLDLEPGDEVVTTQLERGAAVYPWLLEARRRGITVTQLPQSVVPVSPDVVVGRFAAALTPKTRVLAIAHVRATDGTLMPVRELCAMARDKGIFTVIDGALAPGMVAFRVADLGCDAYATSCHHWLNAPCGTGALVLRPEARAKLWPLAVGEPDGWDATDRYEAATPADDGALPAAQAKFGWLARAHRPALQGIGLAVDFQESVRRDRIEARILELASYARRQLATLPEAEILTPVHPSLSAGILSARFPGRNHAALVQQLYDEERIAVGHVSQGSVIDAVRLSLHPCNDFDEIDRCVNALRSRL